MNKCLVRKLLEAGQRILKSISRPPPPQVIFFSFQDISRISWTQFILPPDQPLKGGGVKDFLLNSLQDISRVFLKDFFCLPPQAILKPSGGELGCAPNLAFLWIGLGRRCASAPCAAKLVISKTKILWWKAFENTFIFLIHGRGQTPPSPPLLLRTILPI